MTWLQGIGAGIALAGVALTWSAIFDKPGPAAPPSTPSNRDGAGKPAPSPASGASPLYLYRGRLYTTHGVELDLDRSDWPLTDVVETLALIDRLPEVQA